MSANALLITVVLLHQPSSPSAYIPPNMYLVQANTVATTKTRTGLLGEFSVTRVYFGPGRLKNSRFCRSTAEGGLHLGSSIGPHQTEHAIHFAERGVEGLWWVFEDSSDHRLRPELRINVTEEFKLIGFPCQKHALQWADLSGRPVDVEARFARMLAWAETAEKIYRAPSDAKRAKILRSLAADDQSIAAPWAIALLGRAKKADDIAELKRIAAKESYRGLNQPAIDEVLCRVDPENWNQSETRKRMIRRWLDGRADANLESSGGIRLARAYSEGLDAGILFAAIDDAVSGKNGVQKTKHYSQVARLLREGLPRKSDEPVFFQHFLKFAAYPDNAEIREAAAIGLWHLNTHQWLTAEQYGQIQKLRDRSNDAKVLRRLDFVLEKQVPMRTPPANPGGANRPAANVPKSPAPEFVQIVGVDRAGGVLKLQLMRATPVQRTETRVEKVNGIPVMRTVTVTSYVVVPTQISLPLAQVRLFGQDGKEISGDKVWKELTSGRMVLRALDSTPPDAAYLKLLAKDALILVPRQEPKK